MVMSIDSRNKILHTDEIHDLKDQIDIIRKSFIVILTDGSPALVNSLFTTYSHVIILGEVLKEQMNGNDYFKMIMEENSKDNLSLTILPADDKFGLHFNIDMLFFVILEHFMNLK